MEALLLPITPQQFVMDILRGSGRITWARTGTFGPVKGGHSQKSLIHRARARLAAFRMLGSMEDHYDHENTQQVLAGT